MRPVVPPTSALDLVRHFRQLRVLVIGDAMLDTYLEGEASRLCSEGPVPVVRKTVEHRIPGGAANTAANLRGLEADVMFLSVVGHDIAGSLLRSALHERGISDRWLLEDSSATTLHKLRILADGQYVVRFDEGGQQGSYISPYSSSCQQRLLATLDELYAQCDLVVVSDYCYGVLSHEMIERLRVLHVAQPKVLLLDSKALQRFHNLPATVVTPNYLEARLLVEGMEGRQRPGEGAGREPRGARGAGNLEDVASIARQMLTLLATEHVAVTLAEHGVFLLDRHDNTFHLPAHPVAHANDVGAGDSFASAMALTLGAGGSVEEAARIGIDAAGIAVTRQRTAVVQYQELLQRVSLRTYAAQATGANDIQSALPHLASRLEVERAAGRTIVFTNGVFDILHAGHVHFLREAKALGDVLVVGVNSDSSARRLKGPGRPITSERDRVSLVAAFDVVDHVILFTEDTPTEMIRLLRPHIHVKGGDYADEALPEAEAVREVGGRVVILPLAGSVSTSSVIDRIVALASQQQEGSSKGSEQNVSYGDDPVERVN